MMRESLKEHREIWIKALIAFLCAVQVMIAQTLSTDQVINTYHEISRNPLMYILGLLLLFLIYFAVSLLTKRTLFVFGIITVAINVLTAINYYEIQLHGTVLTFQDVKNVPTAVRALKNYRIVVTPMIAKVIFSLAIILFILAAFYSRRGNSGRDSFKTHRKYAAIPLLVLGAVIYMVFFSPFNIVKNLDGWSWEIRYYVDSMPVGALENLSKAVMGITKPVGYDVAEIAGIEGMSDAEQHASESTVSYPDIVVVLDETWYDFNHLMDFKTDVSYMKNYDALDAIKGYATVPMIGGGTNASEYELLTSNSMALLNTHTPFNDLNLKNSRNVAEYLKQLGYTTMAAHSEPAGNYHRGDSWPALGFEETHFNTDFTELEYYESRYSASDESLFKNFTRFYEEMTEDQPRFAYLLTIQNHGGWDRNSPDKDTIHIQDNNGLAEYEQQINEYLTCIQQTDDFIAEMVDYFSRCERDVVVYMVGDHGPSLLKEWDLGNSVEIDLRKRQVPYFIWSNFDLDEPKLPGNKTIDMCALTPVALKAAGLPLSPYYAQIIRLSDRVQCVTGLDSFAESNSGMSYANSDGRIQSIYSGTEEADLVRNYFYMEYNRLLKKGRLDELYDP